MAMKRGSDQEVWNGGERGRRAGDGPQRFWIPAPYRGRGGLWIPAFAGMTDMEGGGNGGESGADVWREHPHPFGKLRAGSSPLPLYTRQGRGDWIAARYRGTG